MTIAAVPLASAQSRAVPYGGEVTVSGIIDGMWLESDYCYFRISIHWSDSGAFDGESVDVIASFLNESTGRHEEIPSSQGWRIGDEVNATLEYTYSEFGSTYLIELPSKSDENYAEPLSLIERNPFVLYVVAIVAVFAVGQIILLFVLRMKRVRRSGSEEWDILRFMKRI